MAVTRTTGPTSHAKSAATKPRRSLTGPANRRYIRREAKPQDHGLGVEHAWTNTLPILRNPGVRAQRITTGRGYVPDYSAYLPFLTPITDTCQPEVAGRAAFNVLGECKSQTTSGSVDNKIVPEIFDLAAAADVRNVVPFLILDTAPGLFSHAYIEMIRYHAEQSLVAMFTGDELRSRSQLARVRLFNTRLRHVGAQRAELRDAFAPRGGFNRSSYQGELTTLDHVKSFFYRRNGLAIASLIATDSQ